MSKKSVMLLDWVRSPNCARRHYSPGTVGYRVDQEDVLFPEDDAVVELDYTDEEDFHMTEVVEVPRRLIERL